MKQNIFRRVLNPRGETIVETLAAILIAALSCTILMTTVTAASVINRKAKEARSQYEAELFGAESGKEAAGGTGVEGKVTIQDLTSSGGTSGTYTYDVIYTGGEGKLTSYELKTTATGGTGS